MLNSLIEILYILSTSLMIPVIVLLLFFVVWSLMEAGGFIREARERRRLHSFYQSMNDVTNDNSQNAHKTLIFKMQDQQHSRSMVGHFCIKSHMFLENHQKIRKLVTDLEIEAASRLARMSLGIRIGPMLGLMGTLIPLGPALIGLSNGNVEEMAEHLVVAFSTTVLGLLVSGICYGVWLIRRQWYARDLADIEYLYQCLDVEKGTSDIVS